MLLASLSIYEHDVNYTASARPYRSLQTLIYMAASRYIHHVKDTVVL